MSLFIPDDIFREIASFHCHLPQDHRDQLAAQPHIQQLKTLVRTQTMEYNPDGPDMEVITWTVGTPTQANNWDYDFELRLDISEDTGRIMEGLDCGGAWLNWVNAIPSPMSRQNYIRWFDGHFHFGYCPVKKAWLTKKGLALICTDEPTKEQIDLATKAGNMLAARIMQGKSVQHILAIVKAINKHKLKNCIVTVFDENSWDDDYAFGWRNIFQINHKAFLKQLILKETFMTE